MATTSTHFSAQSGTPRQSVSELDCSPGPWLSDLGAKPRAAPPVSGVGSVPVRWPGAGVRGYEKGPRGGHEKRPGLPKCALTKASLGLRSCAAARRELRCSVTRRDLPAPRVRAREKSPAHGEAPGNAGGPAGLTPGPKGWSLLPATLQNARAPQRGSVLRNAVLTRQRSLVRRFPARALELHAGHVLRAAEQEAGERAELAAEHLAGAEQPGDEPGRDAAAERVLPGRDHVRRDVRGD